MDRRRGMVKGVGGGFLACAFFCVFCVVEFCRVSSKNEIDGNRSVCLLRVVSFAVLPLSRFFFFFFCSFFFV